MTCLRYAKMFELMSGDGRPRIQSRVVNTFVPSIVSLRSGVPLWALLDGSTRPEKLLDESCCIGLGRGVGCLHKVFSN
jgi:hypothetical protein